MLDLSLHVLSGVNRRVKVRMLFFKWRRTQVVDETGFETRHTERYREFESHRLRQITFVGVKILLYGVEIL